MLILAVLAVQMTPIAQAQTRTDSLTSQLSLATDTSERVRLMQDLTWALINQIPDSAVQYARTAFRLAQHLGNDTLLRYSYSDMAYCYYTMGDLDSFRITLLTSIDHLEEIGEPQRIAAVYRNLAKIGEASQQPDTSLQYLEKCQEYLAMYPDSGIMADMYLSQGFAYRTKGYYNLSVEALLKSLRIFEALEAGRRLGYVAQNIGITNAMMDRTELAIEYSLKACEYFEADFNDRALAQTKNNLGKMYEDLDDFERSVQAHRESLRLAEQTDQQWVILQNYWNLGRMYFAAGLLDSAEYWLEQAEPIAHRNNDRFLLGGIQRWQARIAIERGQSAIAQRHLASSFNYLEEYSDPMTNQESYEELSMIYEGLGDEGRALDYWRSAIEIKDSLYSLSKDQQIEELNLMYETEKKDAEITHLERENRLEQARQRWLLIGLALLAILAVSIVYTLIMKRRKDRVIRAKERALEAQQRLRIQQELEFKKKELAARVLQLARKNEFLQELEGEVAGLKSSSDGAVSSKSRQIARMIQHDAVTDEDWDQFVSEFSGVHQDFLIKLNQTHGDLTKSELRLVALLKMNLSSKDIASTLRISLEGIKKARYRLRKKFGLDSSVDLQGYLLSLHS